VSAFRWTGSLNLSQFQQFWDPETAERNSDDYGTTEGSMLKLVMLANTPQLIITITYYFYNNALTSMLSSAECSTYGVDRKPLRATWPVKGSQQRSTYWLIVPYQYGIPILILYTILHWLVSQSFHYILLIPYDLHDQPDFEMRIRSPEFSTLPMLLAVLIGKVILCFLAFRRFKSMMLPLAGSCSTAISAACHPPKDDCTDTAALGPLMWGETVSPAVWESDYFDGTGGQIRHCSFPSLDTTRPLLTKRYA